MCIVLSAKKIECFLESVFRIIGIMITNKRIYGKPLEDEIISWQYLHICLNLTEERINHGLGQISR